MILFWKDSAVPRPPTATLDHPNIVPVYESGSVGMVAYLASTYCLGPTLAEWLASQSRPVPPHDVAHLGALLARATGDSPW